MLWYNDLAKYSKKCAWNVHVFFAILAAFILVAFDQWSFCLWCWSNKRECGPLIGLWTSAGMQVLWDYMVNSRPQRLYSPDKYASSDLTSYHMSDAIGLWGVLGTSTQFFFKGVRGCRDQIITKYTGSVLVQVGYLVQLWEVGQSSVTSTRQQRLALQKKMQSLRYLHFKPDVWAESRICFTWLSIYKSPHLTAGRDGQGSQIAMP